MGLTALIKYSSLWCLQLQSEQLDLECSLMIDIFPYKKSCCVGKT